MATGIIYLRPSADISLEHTIYPDTLPAGYLAINEEVLDYSSTYIYNSGRIYTEPAATSAFKLDGEIPQQDFIVTDATICAYITDDALPVGKGVSGEHYRTRNFIVNVDGAEYEFSDNTNANSVNVAIAASDLVVPLNALIAAKGVNSLSEITITITTIIGTSTTDSDTVTTQISQVYLAIDYETGGLNIHHKVNGAWVQAQNVFQKQNGAWAEITEDECINILQNNLIRKQ